MHVGEYRCSSENLDISSSLVAFKTLHILNKITYMCHSHSHDNDHMCNNPSTNDDEMVPLHIQYFYLNFNLCMWPWPQGLDLSMWRYASQWWTFLGSDIDARFAPNKHLSMFSKCDLDLSSGENFYHEVSLKSLHGQGFF
jgi:hypothetical protein